MPLHDLTVDKRSIISEMRTLFISFLRTKGKNILLSTISFLVIFLPFFIWRKSILGFLVSKIFYKSQESRDWAKRPAKVFYSVLIFTFATFMGILTLYALNDWILVTLTVLILTGVLWSLRFEIPRYIEQAKILLNFGPVRENEFIYYRDVPWSVSRLGLYSTLYNPRLEGGKIRVHVREFINQCSRKFVHDAEYFPTKKGDWVELSDNSYGEVILQTPEFVHVKLFGGALKVYKTADFLNLSPVSLADGFLVVEKIGFDYKNQFDVVSDIYPKYIDYMHSVFRGYLDDRSMSDVIIEHDTNDSSCLSVSVNLFCNSALQNRKIFLRRLIHRESLNFFNSHKMAIPFNQLTVHLNNTSKDA